MRPIYLKSSRYGWRPDTPDHRDKAAAAIGKPLLRAAALPATVHLEKAMPAVYDQGQLGSCTANAIGAACEFALVREHGLEVTPSRLAIYYGEREIEGTIASDAGAEIRDGIEVVAHQGFAAEPLWAYDIAKFRDKPPAAYYAQAITHLCVQYGRVDQTVTGIKQVLAAGDPVVFGFSVYDAFESAAVAKSGVLGMPKKTEQLLGGHAVLAVGYTSKVVIVRNSWGSGWGLGGYFTMPWSYITNASLADDLWRITVVKQ